MHFIYLLGRRIRKLAQTTIQIVAVKVLPVAVSQKVTALIGPTDSTNSQVTSNAAITTQEQPGINEATLAQDRSVDPDEIHKFSEMAAGWWDLGGVHSGLHQMNPTRVKYITQQCQTHFGTKLGSNSSLPLAGLEILDVGTGGGLLAESLARLGATVTGVDASQESINIARIHAGPTNPDAEFFATHLSYTCATAEHLLTTSPKRYDVVCALEIVEHVADAPGFVQTIGKLVKPGGLLIMSTLSQTLKSYLFAIVGGEYIVGMLPIGTHDWDKFITPSSLSRLIHRVSYHPDSPSTASSSSSKKLRLRVTDITGMTYHLLTDQWSLTADTDVNYILTAAASFDSVATS